MLFMLKKILTKKITRTEGIILFFSSYFILNQILLTKDLRFLIGIVQSLFFYLIAADLHKITSKSKITKISLSFITISIILITVDTFFRVRGLSINKLLTSFFFLDNGFYDAKFGSFLFSDSNAIAFYSAGLIFLVDYIEDLLKKNFLILKTASFMLFFLCLSRAAIIAVIITKIINKRTKNTFWVLFMLAVTISTFAFLVKDDSSLGTKFTIIEGLLKYIRETNFFVQLIGLGYYNGVDVFGIWLHNIFIIFYVEGGAFSLFLYFFALLKIYKETNKKGFQFFCFLIIASFSYAPYILSYYFVPLGLIVSMEKRSKYSVAPAVSDNP